MKAFDLNERIKLIEAEIVEAENILEQRLGMSDFEDQGDSSSETPEYWEGVVVGLHMALDILNKIK